MRYVITQPSDYLRAELLERETGEETKAFLGALASAALKSGCSKILICVRISRPIFRIEQYQASAYLKELGARPGFMVALVAAREDVRAAHEYVEVIARQHRANVRSFADEPS